MNAALLVASIALLVLAAAAEVWRSAERRRVGEANLQHVDRRLPSQGANRQAGPALPAAPGQLPWEPWLARAGLPGGWHVPLLMVLAGALLAALAAHRIGSPWVVPVTLALYALLCWVWLRRRIEKRQQTLLRQLPDFLDHMVRLTALGNSLPMAFQNAAGHVPMPLRSVLEATLVASRTGLELDRAMLAAAQPTGLRILEVLAVVLGTSMRIGGRADQVLQRMSDFMRDVEQAQHELSATTSETRASAWVIGLLPPLCALLMAVASPDFFQPMIEQPLGHRLLLAALVLESVGALLLYRLARSL